MPIDRARVALELPPAARTWLAAGADRRTWEQLARDAAARAVARLLYASGRDRAGEAGVNPILHALLGRTGSPAVVAVATALGCDPTGREWRPGVIVAAVVAYLQLGTGPGVRRDVLWRARRP